MIARHQALTSVSNVNQSADIQNVITDVSRSTAACDSMWLSQSERSNAATSFTSCDHLLCGYLRLFCLLPSIDLSLLSCIPPLSSPISPVTPPPCFLPQLPPSSEFILLKSFVKLSSALPQDLLLMHCRCLWSFYNVGTFWKLVFVLFAVTLTLQFVVRGQRKGWTFYRLSQGTQKASSRSFLQALRLWCGENGGQAD